MTLLPQQPRQIPRGFDRCVERKQIGLPGDLLDEINHLADFLRGFGEFVDFHIRRMGIAGGNPDEPRRMAELLADFRNRRCQLLGSGCCRINISGCFV